MSADTVWRRSSFEISVIVGCTVLSIIIMFFAEESNVPDTAIATLAAAIIGIAATSLGHASGHYHGTRSPALAVRSGKTILIISILLLAVIVATLLLFIVLPENSSLTRDGGAALCATLLGVTGMVFVNETLLRSSVHVRIGQALLVLSVIGGGIGVLVHPFGLSADGSAALAGAGIAIAGTLLGHANGRLLAKDALTGAVAPRLDRGF